MSVRVKLKFRLLVMACVLMAGPTLAQSSIEAYLEHLVTAKGFSGSVLVAVQGELVVNRGFGYADYEQGVPNTPETVHRIGSLTKAFTAMALLQLFAQQNELSIYDNIDKYLPGIPPAWRPVKIFHLLTHTSGIPDHFGDLNAVPVEHTDREIDRVSRVFKDEKLRTQPGTTYRYSNFGYVLLGYIIERVSGLTYEAYLTQALLDTLQLAHTSYDDPRSIVPGRSEGYLMVGGTRTNDALKDPAAYAAGGLLSTTLDLYRWSKSLHSNVILNDSTRRMMFTPYLRNYGLGWQIVMKNGRTMYNHNGRTHGYSSRVVFYPDEEVFIAVLANNEDIRAAAITCDIESFVFDQSDRLLALPYSMSAQTKSRFVGSFVSEDGATRQLALNGDELIYHRGESTFELSPLSDNTFCFKEFEDYRVHFLNQDTLAESACSVNTLVFRRD